VGEDRAAKNTRDDERQKISLHGTLQRG
jgi:hypothetical protein